MTQTLPGLNAQLKIVETSYRLFLRLPESATGQKLGNGPEFISAPNAFDINLTLFDSKTAVSIPQTSMLHLQSSSTQRWLAQVDSSIEEILIDHAHCERKAATTALNLLNSYTDDVELGREMTTIVQEELEHYWMVLKLLEDRAISFCRLQPGPYGKKLNILISSQEPHRAVDRLLVAGLIEARSCERFNLLRQHFQGRDDTLADFYGGLFESEARHHSTYVRLAENFCGDRSLVRDRLQHLSSEEAKIIDEGCELPRMHS